MRGEILYFQFSSKKNSPQVPGRLAPDYIYVCKLGVDWLYVDFNLLLGLIPQDLEGDLHVDLAHVGDVLSAAAGDLHTRSEYLSSVWTVRILPSYSRGTRS